jgi:uncharacterized protein (TIRG00374 family)
VIIGVRVFLLLTILGIAIIFYITGSEKTWLALRKFHLRYFILASFLILVDLLSGAWRIHIFVKKINPDRSFAVCFKANLANIFLAATTPFQTGGGVAQLYVLNRNGIPYAAGVTVSMLNFVATLSMLFIVASIILTTIPTHLVGYNYLFVVMDISKFAFYSVSILFLLFMFRPAILGKFVQFFFAIWTRIFPLKKDILKNYSNKIIKFIQQYQGYLHYYWANEKFALVLNYMLTIILYFNKCLIAYVIFLGLGLNPNFWQVIMLQLLIIFFLYFAPTPGASLIAETSTTAIMSLIAPTHILSLFTVLWRFFTTYLGVILGSFVFLELISDVNPNRTRIK